MEKDVLGQGSTGVVKRCIKNGTDEEFAVKIVPNKNDREILTLVINLLT